MCRTRAKISSLFEHETLKKKKKEEKWQGTNNSDVRLLNRTTHSRRAFTRSRRNPRPCKCLSGNRGTSSRQTFPSEARSVLRPCPKNMHVPNDARVPFHHPRLRSPPFNPRESEGLGAISETSRSPRDVSSGYTTSSCLISLISIPPPFPSRFVLLLSLRFALNFSAKGRPFPTSFASLRSTIPLFSISSPSSTSCCSCFFFSSSRDFFRSNISKRVGIEAVGKQGGFWWEKRRKGLRDSLKRGPGGSFSRPRKRARE